MNQVTKFWNEVDKLTRNGKHNTMLYATRARDIINSAYWQINGEFVRRDLVSQDKVDLADKLVAMGAIEAVYGRGRQFLH